MVQSVVENVAVPDPAPRAGPVPVIFGRTTRPLFGFYHPAEGSAPRRIGIVLCNPLGYEAMCAHKTYRHLALRLAARGCPTLRFDYHGTDDSSGDADEAARMSAWLESIDDAVDELRDRAGVRSIGLFGTRFGATLATMVAAKRGDIDSLLLWAPSPSGRAYLRELRAFRLIKQPGGAPPPQRSGGGEEAAGYLFSQDTVADLSAVDLLAGKERVANRVLIVPRDDLPGGEARLGRVLAASGAAVRVAEDPGYARMMRDPQETVVPEDTLEKMVDWLEEVNYPESRPAHAPKSVSGAMTVRSGAKKVDVTERPILFGPDNRLFGIVTEPADLVAARKKPAVLLLNVGANHRVGPNRMYVRLARDLASRGIVSFRFDVAGLGDSRTAAGERESRLYSKDSVGDVKAAMSLVTDRYGNERFILIGLCSGAYLAFHTCVEDERVTSQVLLNPQTFEWKEGDSLELAMRKSYRSTRYYSQAIFDPVTWRRGIRQELNLRGIAGILRERLLDRAKDVIDAAGARIRGHGAKRSEIESAFRAMSRRGVDSLLVFSFMDGGIDMIEKHLGRDARRMRGMTNFRLELIEGADHTFTPIDSQVALHDLLMGHVLARFA